VHGADDNSDTITCTPPSRTITTRALVTVSDFVCPYRPSLWPYYRVKMPGDFSKRKPRWSTHREEWGDTLFFCAFSRYDTRQLPRKSRKSLLVFRKVPPLLLEENRFTRPSTFGTRSFAPLEDYAAKFLSPSGISIFCTRLDLSTVIRAATYRVKRNRSTITDKCSLVRLDYICITITAIDWTSRLNTLVDYLVPFCTLFAAQTSRRDRPL